MTDTVSDTTLRMERLIAAPPERVFAFWTDPALLVKWWGPEHFDVPAHAIDVRQGGGWRTTMRSPEGKLFAVSGMYRRIEPPHLLVFTWAWDDDTGGRGHETEVTVAFEAAPGGTRLILTQQGFDSRDACASHQQGWSSSLGCLARAAD
jgi:uncharacterized protein YndB with AHSA1/START domain